jgi:hypothetical protein
MDRPDAEASAVSDIFRITTALAQHADVNSMDCCTLAGTSARSIRSNSNLEKNCGAVVVSRNNAGVPSCLARSRRSRRHRLPCSRLQNSRDKDQ